MANRTKLFGSGYAALGAFPILTSVNVAAAVRNVYSPDSNDADSGRRNAIGH